MKTALNPQTINHIGSLFLSNYNINVFIMQIFAHKIFEYVILIKKPSYRVSFICITYSCCNMRTWLSENDNCMYRDTLSTGSCWNYANTQSDHNLHRCHLFLLRLSGSMYKLDRTVALIGDFENIISNMQEIELTKGTFTWRGSGK